jgi:4-hydroxybenzoate polyprenyltransferase
MVAARTSAMSFNRIVDHRIDAENPRTADRALPAGRLSRRFAWFLVTASAATFVFAAAMLNELCLLLSVPTLAVLLGYSYAKRFTWAAHLWLGLALGLAPIGAWVAASRDVGIPAALLACAVMFWVAGFDIIYSLQDEGFDRSHGLRSIPARFGTHRALTSAGLFHAAAIVGFAAFALQAGGGWIRFAAVALAGALLVWQHRLIRSRGLHAVDAAFFAANGVLSVSMLALFLIAKAVG